MSNYKSTYLQNLWESLHQLFLQLSHEMHARRLLKYKMKEPKNSLDIWVKLKEYIENVPVLENNDIKHPAPKHEASLPNNAPLPQHTRSSAMQEGNTEPLDFENISAPPHPHVSDQLHRNAMDHISTSIYLAKNGNRFGAKLHLELAESAVQTASQFMSDEEYRDFEYQVVTRIQNL